MSENGSLTPMLKWAGGKRYLAPRIAELYKQSKRKLYVEPFCGGMAVALEIAPSVAYLNDVNPHLINFYRQVRRGLHFTIEMRYNEALYYDHRDRFNQLIRDQKQDTVEAAELFYYLNRTCFNGLCRFNKSGFFNVPFGEYTTVNYASDFDTHTKLLKNWTFQSDDFALTQVAHEDFMYVDPPYDVVFTTYSAGGFKWEDQVRLHTWLLEHPGPTVVSNQATERIIDLYSKEFKIELISAPRRISRTGDRTPAQEMFATRNL